MFPFCCSPWLFPSATSRFFLYIAPQSISYMSVMLNNIDSESLGFFFFSKRMFLRQNTTLATAGGFLDFCALFSCMAPFMKPGGIHRGGVKGKEKEEEERREPLHPKWGFRRIYSRLFWRPLRFYCPSTSSYNAPWSSELSPCQGSPSSLKLARGQ